MTFRHIKYSNFDIILKGKVIFQRITVSFEEYQIEICPINNLFFVIFNLLINNLMNSLSILTEPSILSKKRK